MVINTWDSLFLEVALFEKIKSFTVWIRSWMMSESSETERCSYCGPTRKGQITSTLNASVKGRVLDKHPDGSRAGPGEVLEMLWNKQGDLLYVCLFF